jgi:mono/diheme cytochrome c family protein
MTHRISQAITKSTTYLAALLLAACGGGDGSGVVQSPPPASPPPPPPPAFGATFSEIQANVFTVSCATSGCHAGAAAPQGLQLDTANSFALLVNAASTEVPALLRVAPNDPDASYLVQKIEGTAAVGGRMPLNDQPLEATTVATIRQWISDGALDDRVQSPDPIRVTSLVPMPGASLSAAPASIVAMFDRELDVSTINSTTFLLEASGGDGSFGDGNEQSIAASAITAPNTAPMSATFALSGTTLANDTYRVTLSGSAPSQVQDIAANALDGEFGGSFPSGDGSEGGDFITTFEVAVPVATLDEIQASVFSASCAGCHSGPTSNNLPSGMNLSSADASFASLVGVASIQVPTLSRVAPNDPDLSYLVQKIEGTATQGQRMPIGGVLSQDQVDDIREWISNGANR